MIDLMSIPAIRSWTWRIGRRLYFSARRDIPNCPVSNGEYWLIERFISESSSNIMILMDIGANQGNWSAQAKEILNRQSKNGVIYAFEPTPSTYSFLSKRFEADSYIKLNKIALSNYSGEAEFFVMGALAGTNSLHNMQDSVVEKVQTQRFDDFLASAGLETGLFVKSDTEGHDLSVLRGAEKSLRSGCVDVWQFEYNHRWVANHSFLKDVFDFIADKPYRLGKLYGNGIEIYEKWHPELERFFEANYVLIRNGSCVEKLGDSMCLNISNVLVPAR